jgi:hypothetical protein
VPRADGVIRIPVSAIDDDADDAVQIIHVELESERS